jgi:hypothetical protein
MTVAAASSVAAIWVRTDTTSDRGATRIAVAIPIEQPTIVSVPRATTVESTCTGPEAVASSRAAVAMKMTAST